MTSDGRRHGDYVYLLQGNGEYGFGTGKDPSGRQVLFGILGDERIGVFFDEKGRVESSRIEGVQHSDPAAGAPSAVDSLYPELASWSQELGVVPETIRIQRFHIPLERDQPSKPWEYDGVGIEDLPWHYRAFLANPATVEERDRKTLQEEIENWIRRGDFVLWWGNDFDINRDGEVVSS
jgi:hypothetical protein